MTSHGPLGLVSRRTPPSPGRCPGLSRFHAFGVKSSCNLQRQCVPIPRGNGPEGATPESPGQRPGSGVAAAARLNCSNRKVQRTVTRRSHYGFPTSSSQLHFSTPPCPALVARAAYLPRQPVVMRGAGGVKWVRAGRFGVGEANGERVAGDVDVDHVAGLEEADGPPAAARD